MDYVLLFSGVSEFILSLSHMHAVDVHVWAMIIQHACGGHCLAYECLHGTPPKMTKLLYHLIYGSQHVHTF